MPTALEELKVILGADVSDYERKLDRVSKANRKFNDDIAKIGSELTTKLTLPIVGLTAAFVAMAGAEEAADMRLTASLRNLGISFKNVETQVRSTIGRLETLTGFNDTDLQDSFNRLLIVTQDYEGSLKSLSVTTDLARATGMDLETAAQLIGRAYNGNGEALKRYGIQLDSAVRGTAALAQISQRVGGTAEQFGQSFQGAMLRLKNTSENAAEAFGRALMPAAMKLLSILNDLAVRVLKIAEAFEKSSPAMKTAVTLGLALVAALGPMVYAYGKLANWLPLVIGFMKTWGVTIAGVVGQAIILAGVPLVIITNWENVERMFKSVFYAVGGVLSWAAGKWLAFVELIYGWVPGLGGKIRELKTKVDDFADGMGDKFSEAASNVQGPVDMMQNTFDVLKGKFGELGTWMGFGLDGMQAQADAKLPTLKQTFEQWMTSLDDKTRTFAQSIQGNMSQLFVDIVSTIAQGTFDAKKLFLSFLVKSLEAYVGWAVAKLAVTEGLTKGIVAALTNPIVAIFAIPALIAGIYALSASFKPALASGGMSTGPADVLIGDNVGGKEAVLPLNSPSTTAALSRAMPGGQGGMGLAILQVDGRELARAVFEHFPDLARAQGITV